MERRHCISIALVVLLFLGGAGVRFLVDASGNRFPSAPAKRGLAEPRGLEFQRDIEPILARHCYGCHGEGMDKGGVVLDEFANEAERIAALGVWEGVHHNVEGALMPPSEKPRLPDRERERLIAWIERKVFQLDPRNPDPGHVTVRRLNRVEYRNSIRDLLGDLPLDPSGDLPPDDTGYGFDTVGDVLSMSPALLEKYVLAADRVLSASIQTHPPEPDLRRFEPETDFRGIRHAPDGTGDLSSEGTVGVRLAIGRSGDYRARILVGADHAGDELPKMKVRLPGGPERIFEIEATTSHPRFYDFTVEAPRGERWLELAFINDFYQPNHPDPRRRDRNLHIRRVDWIGPLNLEPPPPSRVHQEIFAAGGTGPDRVRAGRIVKAFARRAWCRPISGEEVERLLRFVDLAREQGDSFESGVKLVLQAILVSPRFLFRGEGLGGAGERDEEAAVVALTELELASRLSYFLWSSLPDERLLALAEGGELRRNLKGEVARMLNDPKSIALTENFAGQWLQLRNLDLVTPDPQTYPGWDEDLRRSMRRETELFFQRMVAEDRKLGEFLDARFTFLDERLARHYGIGGVEGGEFRKVSLAGDDAFRRGGLLTHASILTITSNPTRTSPVNRGNWVLENILGTPPPPPLDDVPELGATGAGGERLSLRQQLELHREKPLCASCHARMDPIGFAMESYDGIGTWREEDAGRPVDTSGMLYTGESFANLAELRRILAGTKQEAFVRHLIRTMLTYALGRGVQYQDKPAINAIHDRVEMGGFRTHALIEAIVDSVPFQFRRGSGWDS